MAKVIGALALCAGLAGCGEVPSFDVGCRIYAEQRESMPRPLGEGALPEWVAATDSAMTACP